MMCSHLQTNYFTITLSLFVCLTPLSRLSLLNTGGQFYWWRKPEEVCGANTKVYPSIV
jgi:hypothetical protein